MESRREAVDWSASFAPLFARYGSRLTLTREANRAAWTMDGRSAVVEIGSGDELRATFVDVPQLDPVTGRRSACEYRSPSVSYRFTASGASRMAADMLAFFSGVREPFLEFVGVREAALRRRGDPPE